MECIVCGAFAYGSSREVFCSIRCGQEYLAAQDPDQDDE